MPPTDRSVVEKHALQGSTGGADSILVPKSRPLNLNTVETKEKNQATVSGLKQQEECRVQAEMSQPADCASTCQLRIPGPRKVFFRQGCSRVATKKRELFDKGDQQAPCKDHSTACSEFTKASPLSTSLSAGEGRDGCPKEQTTGEGGGDGINQDGADRASARRRAAEKREEIQRDHLKRREQARQRRSKGRGDGEPAAAIAGTVLFRPNHRAMSFRVLPRELIVNELRDIQGVAAVRVNFQRNVVAVDSVDRPTVQVLVATKSICGLDVVGRELASPPGTSSGIIYDNYKVKGRFTISQMAQLEIMSRVPVRSLHPTKLGRNMLVRFNGPAPPAQVTLIGEDCYVELEVKPNRPRPLQCSNCGRFNHETPSCLHPSRCMRCGKSDGHTRDSCTAEPKCGNCGRPHAMTDRRCRVWKQERRVEAALTAPGVTSRNVARKSVRADYRDLWPRVKKLRRRCTEPSKKKEKAVVVVPSVFVSPSSLDQKAPECLKKTRSCATKQALDKKTRVAFVPSVFLTSPPPTFDQTKCKAPIGALGAKLPQSRDSVPRRGKAQPAKGAAGQKKTAAERCMDATKVGPKGQLSCDNGWTHGRGTSTRVTTMPSSPHHKKSAAVSVSQWLSTQEIVHGAVSEARQPKHAPTASKCSSTSIPPPARSQASGAGCQPKKNTRGASSKTVTSTSACGASSSGAGGSKNGTSAKGQDVQRDQEEAFLGVLAQLARALRSGCEELPVPAESCKTKKKGSGKKKR